MQSLFAASLSTCIFKLWNCIYCLNLTARDKHLISKWYDLYLEMSRLISTEHATYNLNLTLLLNNVSPMSSLYYKLRNQQIETPKDITARCNANRWGCCISTSNAPAHPDPSAPSRRQRTVQSSVFGGVEEEWEGAKPRRPQPSAGSRMRNEWCLDKGQSKEGRPNRKTKKGECAGRCLPEQENVLIPICCILFLFFCCVMLCCRFFYLRSNQRNNPARF